MHKFLSVCLVCVATILPGAGRANDLSNDTSDPLYLQAIEEILTKTDVSYWDHILRLGQGVSYGMNNRLSIGANVHYQNDFNGDEDGFSAIDVGGIYRMSGAVRMCVPRTMPIPHIMPVFVLVANGRG